MQEIEEDEAAICVDVEEEEDVVEEVLDLVEEIRLVLMLPCMCRMQVPLDRLCNRDRVQPQCPRISRETE